MNTHDTHTTIKPLDYYSEQVNRPGKYEGEHAITPYLYECLMEGDGDLLATDDEGIGILASRLVLTFEEQRHFNLSTSELIVIEDSQGFVMSMTPAKFVQYVGKEIAQELRMN
tara:strand:+ start:129 stop:467 length:339 start_codon:yes stop_codon:yes gene_type:complete